jgi:hypothetical protein
LASIVSAAQSIEWSEIRFLNIFLKLHFFDQISTIFHHKAAVQKREIMRKRHVSLSTKQGSIGVIELDFLESAEHSQFAAWCGRGTRSAGRSTLRKKYHSVDL